MKVHIVCYEDVHGWILGKFALKLQEHLRPLGVAATISKQPDPQADINHHIIYYDYDGRKTTTETVMVTHIDTDWKRERLRQQLINAAMGICMSAETVDNLVAAGLPREKLCFVNPGHDGVMRPRRTVVGITSKVQPSGCKREGMLLELAQRLSPDEFQFRIMGAGWEEHVKHLRLAGFTVDHWNAFNRDEYLKLMPGLDYYLYLGMDEGSMGFVDALAAGVPTIVTTQGYHLDAPGGITHGFSDAKELLRVFEGISRDKRLRQQAVGDWTWPEYAKRHLALWRYLLARQSGQPLNASLRAPLAKMAVLVDKGAFAEAQPVKESVPVKSSDGAAQSRELPLEVIRSLRAQHSHLMGTNPAAAANFRKQFAKEPLDALVTDFDGDLQFRCSLHHHIGSQIFWHGGYSQAQLRLLSRLLTSPDMVYLDAGANVGEQTIFAAKRLPRGQVFAFEPTTEVFQVLSENVRANGFKHVRAEKLGLGDQPGELPIYSSHAEVASDGTVNEGVPTLFSSTERGTLIERVKIVRLDDFLAPLNLARLDVMKVDVEGAEMIVLKGAAETIKRHRPVLIVEVHEGTSQSAGHSVRELLQFIESLGYRIEGLQADGGTRRFGSEELSTIRDVVCYPVPVTVKRVEPVRAAGSRPRILLIADVPNWVFHRHCQTLTERLGDEFEFTTQFHGQAFDEDAFDLIYPLEWNMVLPQQVKNPAKYVTALRSHVSWQDQDFLAFAELLAARFQRVHVVSERLAKLFRPLVPQLDHFSHGVDKQFFQPSTRADQSGRKLRLGWAGNRACPTKGFAELIAPLGKLPGVELVFCGYSDKNLDRAQMKVFYDSLDAYVCTSQWEGNNNSLLEAAAMQRAIITTDNGTVPEYLRHGESALIVERQLPDLIHAVIQLRDNPALRVVLGEQARSAVVAKFDWSLAVERYREFFRAGLAGRGKFQSASGVSQRHVALRAETPVVQSADPLAEIEGKAREALALNPDGVEALELLCNVLLRREQWAEVTALCVRLLKLKPDDRHTLARLAKAFFGAGERDAARATLERMLELNPADELARENLKAFDEVAKDEPASEFPPAVAAELKLATAALEQGDLPAAHAIYHRVFKANPDDDRLRELAALATAEVRAACAVPDFGGAVRPARLNIAVLTYNALHYTQLCLASLRQHTTEPYNVFIVDNGSTDGTREWLAAQTDENLFVEFSPANLGVPGGRNRLLQLIQPHLRDDGFVIFMDNDIEVMPGWGEHFSNFFAAHPHVGIGTAVGHQFVVRGDVRELGAVPVGVPAPVDVACGGFVCWMRSATVKAVGEYDERLGLFWHEDDDYSVRALAEGWEVFIVPGAPVLHHEHKSGAAKPGLKVGGSPANQRYLASKWRAMGVVNADGRIRRPAPQRPLAGAPMRKSRVRVSLPVRWAAPFFNPTGYASEAINFVLPLSHQLNLSILHDTQITSDKFVAELPADDHDRLMALHDKVFLMRGGIFVTHNPGHGFKRVADALYHVGRTMFETDRIPADWVGCCNAMDEVWVPSRFNVETFANSGVERDKLVVIPGAVDEGLFDPAKHTPLALPNPAKFNFVSVFEWSARKAWDVLLAAYLREFSAEDDVCLHLRTSLFGHPDADPRDTLEPLIRNFAGQLGLGRKPLPRIELLAEQIPTRDLPRLYLAGDCVVVPSRGEGWGRPMHEAMAMGRPVIATGWSANLEFMNAENSYLLDYELAEVKGVEPYLKHYLGHRWANPSEKHLRELMRRVRENPTEAQAKGALARAHVTTHFSRAAVAEKVMQRFEAIERKFTTPACPAVLCRQFATAAETNGVRPTAITGRRHEVSVAWDGSFLDYGSLSHVNRELTGALEKLPGMRVTRLGQSALNAPAGLHEVARSLKAAAPAGTQVTVRHAWPPVWDTPRTGKWVQIQPWEFGALPVEWAKHAVRADEIWCYSNYVRHVYLGAGLDPAKVKVMPLGIDPGRFRPEAKPLPLATRKRFKFLFVGGTILRKGPDVLLRACLEAFTAADDVCLVIKDFGGNSVYQGQTFSAQIKAAQSQPNAPEIIHLTEELSPEALPGLYTACDCLVHPYRGEGFGLPVLEAMACGLPVVVTGGGSTDDFATDDFAFRLPATRRPIGNQVGELELVSRGWLLEPDAHALREQLRAIAREPADARAKGRAASAHVREHWTWQRAAETAAARLRALAGAGQAAQTDRIVAPAYPQPTVSHGGDSASGGLSKFQLKIPPVGLVGDLKGAREALTKGEHFAAWTETLVALKARPFHPEAWLLLAETALAAGDVAMARECSARARQLVPHWKAAKKFQKELPARGRDWKVRWPAPPPKAAQPRLTVFVIAKNEERFLGQCLASVKGLAQQLIVLDTGSTDRTEEIAKEHGAEVHSHAWNDDFSAARNAALAHATGDWVLFLDADEELPAGEHEQLRAEMEVPGVMAVRLRLQNVGQEDDGQCHVPRLWRNAPGLFFHGRVHEQIFPSVLVKCEAWGMETRLGTATLRHHGYAPEVIKDRNKVARNLRLLRLAVEELPGEPMLLMNLGLELVRSGELREGLGHYREAFRRLEALPEKDVVPELREALVTQFVCHLHTAKEFAEVLRVLQSPFAKQGGLTASMHFMAALACLELKRFADGAEHARQCLMKRQMPTLSPVNRDIRKAGPHHVLALCLWGAQRHDDVEQAFLDALAEDAGARAAQFDFARWLAERGRKLDALHLLHKLVAGSENEPRVWLLGAQIALGSPEFIEFACDWTGEAVAHQPDHAGLAALRAEALLLAGRASEALSAMEQLPAGTPLVHAIRLLAALGCEGELPALDDVPEGAVSGEFLRWYRRLIEFRANDLLLKVNERLPELRHRLPSAARVLAAAVEEAATPAR